MKSNPLDPELAAKIAEAAKLIARSTRRRDRLICEAAATGATLRAIGAVAGLSPAGVKLIVDRQKEAGDGEDA